jgi:hypothetical protein
LGVLGGLAADKVFVPGDYVDGLLVGVIFYLISYYIARYLWFRELARENLGKIYSTGIGSYVLTFLFTWILLVTLVPA